MSIVIDAENMLNGFILNLTAAIGGYSYSDISLKNENSDAVETFHFYDPQSADTSITVSDPGKYTINLSGGLDLNIYKVSVNEIKQFFITL